MDEILELIKNNGTLKKYPLQSGHAIRRFSMGDKNNEEKYNYALNRWYPGTDSLTTKDAMRGISLLSWRLGILVNLNSTQVCYTGTEKIDSYFNFPIEDFSKRFPSCTISFSPDFENDPLAIRGFCHLTLHIGSTQTETRKQVWTAVRDWLIKYAKNNYEKASLRLPY